MVFKYPNQKKKTTHKKAILNSFGGGFTVKAKEFISINITLI